MQMLMLPLAMEETNDEYKEMGLVVVEFKLRTEYAHIVVVKITLLTCVGMCVVNH